MDTKQSLGVLNQTFTIPGVLRFEAGEGGLVRAVVDNPDCSGSIYLHGAHVSAFQPRGHEPVLFISRASAFAAGKPIRGGVPICFPWFGPHATDKSAPSHGPARLTAWRLQDVHQNNGAVTLQLSVAIEPFVLGFRVTFGQALSMVLSVKNTSHAPAGFEAALHSYFEVADVRRIEISGLENADYLDKVDGGKRKNQGDQPIRFTGETDRVYVGTRSTCVLTDPGLRRQIRVEKSGSLTTVVWNPWINKSKAMPDFGDDEWPGMVCIETANAGPDTVTLDPGKSHDMSATISVTGL